MLLIATSILLNKANAEYVEINKQGIVIHVTDGNSYNITDDEVRCARS